MNTADILEKAADLIEPEGAWTQGHAARDQGGGSKPFNDADAVCWCALGAIWRTADTMFSETVTEAEEALLSVVKVGVAVWNDAPERTQAEVVAKLREAAALAREQQQ